MQNTPKARSYGLSPGVSQNVVDYLHPLLNFLITPFGMVALVALVSGAIYALRGRRGRELLIFVVTLTGMVGYLNSIYWNNTLIPPLEMFRGLCKPMFVIGLGLMTIRYAFSRASLRQRPVRGAALALAALVVLYSLRLSALAPERAVGGVLMVALLFFGVMQYLRQSITTGEDIANILSAAVAAGLAFFALSAIQLRFDASRILVSGRFLGLSQNPQTVGETTAPLFLMANFLIISGFSSRRQRILGIAGVLVMTPFLIWTGSRTGMGMTVVGLLILNGAKARRWIAPVTLMVVAWEIYAHLYHHATKAAMRLGSTVNDRAAVWERSWQVFLNHPLFGESGARILIENSFLSVAMTMGVVGLVVLALLAVQEGQDILFIFSHRGRLDVESRKFCEFVCALAISFVAGMFFDAYLMAIATTQAILAYMIMAFTSVAYDLVVAKYAAGDQSELEAPQRGAVGDA
ncbi:MAG: O-antigen ligase family protein [Phycisphaerae bacterium]